VGFCFSAAKAEMEKASRTMAANFIWESGVFLRYGIYSSTVEAG
jgi:hypothetical protein